MLKTMSRIVDLYRRTYISRSSSASPKQFIVSDTLSGEGVYPTWRSMWEKISLTTGPQIVYIHGDVELTAITSPEMFNFDGRIEVRGINNGMDGLASLTIKTYALLSGCTKFSNMVLKAEGDSYPIFISGGRWTITLDGVECFSTQASYPLFNVGENTDLNINIVNNKTELGQYSVGLTGGSLELTNYGLSNKLTDSWLVDNTAGVMSSSVYITQYSPLKISSVLPEYMIGENSFPEISRYETTAYMTFGGLINSTGFALPNAVPGATIPEFGGTVDTQWLCPVLNGYIQEIICNTQSGNQFTQMQLKINGITERTFQLPPSGKGSILIPSIDVDKSNSIEVYFEAGENVNPGKSSFTVIIC
jgi:hypothetical protein